MSRDKERKAQEKLEEAYQKGRLHGFKDGYARCQEDLQEVLGLGKALDRVYDAMGEQTCGSLKPC